jgi:hypothetical protein
MELSWSIVIAGVAMALGVFTAGVVVAGASEDWPSWSHSALSTPTRYKPDYDDAHRPEERTRDEQAMCRGEVRRGLRDPCRRDQSDATGSYRRRDRSRLTRRATVRLSGDRSVAATRLHRCAASHLDLVVGPVRDIRVNAADARLWHP